MQTSWITAFIDVPATRYDVARTFWAGVTGSTLSASRGADDQFATFDPPDGDAYLRLQRLGSGPAGVHLDLHQDHDFELVRSPGGFTLCLNDGDESVRPLPRIWAEGQASLVDQVCLDVPPHLYDDECDFWAEATGWELAPTSAPYMRQLVRGEQMPLRILLQRLDEGSGPVRAHLDLATTDRGKETDRHRTLGARVQSTHQRWTVLEDPAGMPYCITDRDPYTGLL